MAGDQPIRWGSVTMTREQVAQVLYKAGFRGQDLINFVGIAFRESGGHPNLYVERPSTGDWSYGLFGLNIGRNRSLWPVYQKMGFTDPEQLATAEGGAKAAYQLFQQRGYYPWGGYKGKSGTYGTDLKAAADAVQRAGSQGLLGQDYTGDTGGAPPPTDLAGIKKWMDAHEATFNAYLKTLPADQQQQIIGEINQPRDLAGVSDYLNQAPSGVKDYIGYLSQLPEEQQAAAKSRLGVQTGGAFDQPSIGPDDPAGSQATSDLLNTLGVSYPNAPQPTPALLAFINSLGMNLQTAEQMRDRAIERIGAAASDARSDITRTAGRTKQNVTADLIRRNVVTSGEANTRYARHAEDVADQQGNVNTNEVNQKTAATDIYAQSRDMVRQQALDRVISAEQDQATQKAASKAQEDAFRRQQDASDLSFARQQQAQQDSIQQQKDLLAQQASQGFAQ